MKNNLLTLTLILLAGTTLCALAEPPENSDRPEKKQMRERMLKHFDKDGDGVLCDSEKTAMKTMMQERKARADLDGDGTVSEEERKTAHAEMLKRLDTNGDGEISKEEREAARPGKGKRQTEG